MGARGEVGEVGGVDEVDEVGEVGGVGGVGGVGDGVQNPSDPTEYGYRSNCILFAKLCVKPCALPQEKLSVYVFAIKKAHLKKSKEKKKRSLQNGNVKDT